MKYRKRARPLLIRSLAFLHAKPKRLIKFMKRSINQRKRSINFSKRLINQMRIKNGCLPSQMPTNFIYEAGCVGIFSQDRF